MYNSVRFPPSRSQNTLPEDRCSAPCIHPNVLSRVLLACVKGASPRIYKNLKGAGSKRGRERGRVTHFNTVDRVRATKAFGKQSLTVGVESLWLL